ncbi:glycoside hydrolase family protein [Flagellimonas sp. HMM57]|uniref:glycoside hydrolase family protein n=1 Tax=unclassified Flagellimonas TaxID=2644544 RepID=UPI0013D4C797|nr:MULTISPECIES: glycoside hydrolase family protein [unclassified Flagellimonas]UII75355.1 glycoside hydrolase family protein [Flagellimonas sp. HMM57]
MRLAIICILTVVLSSCQPKKEKEPAKEFALEFGAAPSTAVFKDSTYSIWGATLTKGNDGLYHMFYSRWLKSLGSAWTTHSEIAHAVSESPFGPFEHKDVALPPRGAEYWDGLCTHNPTIHKFGDTYYLYYMGNTGDGINYSTPTKGKLNWVHRNNQRIGVAVAKDPNGPWERMDVPLVDVGKDSTSIDALCVTNPSVTQGSDGKFLMVYKAVGKKRPGVFGGPVVHCVATSDSPTGPFKKHPDPIFTVEGSDFPAEDPSIYYYKGKYRAIVKDVRGDFTGIWNTLACFESENGIDWQLSANPLASKRQIKWEDGEIEEVELLERPQVYMENGEPKLVLCAVKTTTAEGHEDLRNVQIPLIIGEKILNK